MSLASAATVNVSTDAGTTYIATDGIGVGTSVSGGSLAGMEVMVAYSDGSSETLTWGARANDRHHGEVTSAGMSLDLAWWDFTLSATNRIASIAMSTLGLPAVFDISTSDPADDTEGTGRGVSFDIRSGAPDDGEIGVAFSNQVLADGDDSGIDLFTDVMIDFSGLEDGGFFGNLNFVMDFDPLASSNLEAVSEVPLPPGLPLLMAGIVGLGLVKRRKS